MSSRTSRNKTIWESIKENIRYSLSVSSISGVSHISYEDRRTKLERLLWILIIILMIGLAASQGLQVFNHYQERPVIVTVDKSFFDWKLTFPSATLCFRDLKEAKELNRIIDNLVTRLNLSGEILTSEKGEFLEYLRDLAFKNYFNYEDLHDYASGMKKEYLTPDQYMEVLDEVVWSLKFPKNNRRIRSPMTFPLNQTRPVLRIFTEYGPCMTFNPCVGIYYTPEYFNSSDSYEKCEEITFTKNVLAAMTLQDTIKSDIEFYLHGSNEVMDIIDTRSVVRGGNVKHCRFGTDIVTISEDAKSLSVKQKNCRLTNEPTEKLLDHVPVYSYHLCKFEYRIKIAMKYCNCTPYYYRRSESLLYLKSDTPDLCPSCPQNCEVKIFRESELLTAYPFPLSTVLGVSILFPDKIYIRNLVFSKIDLIVQIGGIFGLFLGCSLLSFVEIVYFLTLRLFFGARDRNKGERL